jgi:hypothetical protein
LTNIFFRDALAMTFARRKFYEKSWSNWAG